MGKKEKEVRRVVIDTNVMVSALLFKGSLSKIVDHWKEGKFIPLLSKETFNEFKTVLEYPKFSLTTQEIKVIIEEEVLPFFEIVEVAGKISRMCRDSDDDKFIACAVSASADFIVSGDRDLLDMGKYKSVKIISAPEFLKMF
jgi:putative PIN family toxin of toxin-antitoxin system